MREIWLNFRSSENIQKVFQDFLESSEISVGLPTFLPKRDKRLLYAYVSSCSWNFTLGIKPNSLRLGDQIKHRPKCFSRLYLQKACLIHNLVQRLVGRNILRFYKTMARATSRSSTLLNKLQISKIVCFDSWHLRMPSTRLVCLEPLLIN